MIRHCKTFHIAPNSAPHYPTSLRDLVVLKCVCWAGNVWFDVNLWWWDVACITRCHCISHLITLPPHFTLHHSTSNAVSGIIPNHTIIPHHITPTPLAQYSTLQYHISKLPHVSATVMHPVAPHLALHPILHMYHITPHAMYSMPHFRSRRIVLATLCIAPHFASHFTQHCTAFHHNWPWSYPIPNPTTMFHNIPHRT